MLSRVKYTSAFKIHCLYLPPRAKISFKMFFYSCLCIDNNHQAIYARLNFILFIEYCTLTRKGFCSYSIRDTFSPQFRSWKKSLILSRCVKFKRNFPCIFSIPFIRIYFGTQYFQSLNRINLQWNHSINVGLFRKAGGL